MLDMRQLKRKPAVIKTLCNAFPFGGEKKNLFVFLAWFSRLFFFFLPQKTIPNDDCSVFLLMLLSVVNVKI